MGKIGKPQKTKRHKKLKVTFDNEHIAEGNTKKLQNLPVSDLDLDKQDIPRKLQDIIKSQAECDSQISTNKLKRKQKFVKDSKKYGDSFRMERGMTRPLQKIPRFVQGKFEKDRHFIGRVELETQRVIMKHQIEDKYKIDLSNAGPNLSVASMKRKPSERKREKDKERKKKKLKAKKEKKHERLGDFNALKDQVMFGEVAMAPPTLTVKPRKANLDPQASTVGKRSLLLQAMFENSSSSSTNPNQNHPTNQPKSLIERQAGQTVKRKLLTPLQRQVADTQRQNAINRYRKLKEKVTPKMQ